MASATAVEPGLAPLWFRLPPGFVDLDPDELPTIRDQVVEDVAILCSDPSARDQRLLETDVLLNLLSELPMQGITYLAFGLHTGGDAGFSTSVLSFADVPTNAPTSTMAAAQCALELVLNPLGSVVTRELLEIPCGSPAALVTCLLPEPPTEVPGHKRDVFQTRLGVARPTGSHVVVVDLTTTTVELADEYTEILRGIGQTISFTDPTPKHEAHSRSRIWEALQ
ncbi:hypothetical protein [Streptomyces sp. NBC_00467]|uniref:hypothetical protein n=1 Tax=Streptomyces sp. NBC_00467 TaxID=2975752 RepID=UPI002E17F11A